MPGVGKPGNRRRQVPGLYARLLERERGSCAQIDPRTLPRFNPASPAPRTVVETGIKSRALLDALEAGEPVQLQGRQLRGRSLPAMPLRRDQASDWFEVSADDTVKAVASRPATNSTVSAERKAIRGRERTQLRR
jgi:hypothetical protein